MLILGHNCIVLLKNDKKFFNHSAVRPNSDFMVLNTWMSILLNVYITNNVNIRSQLYSSFEK